MDVERITKELFSDGLRQTFGEICESRADCDLFFNIKIIDAQAASLVKIGKGSIRSKVSYEVAISDKQGKLIESLRGEGSYEGRGKVKSADVVRGLFALGTLGLTTVVTEAFEIESDFEGSLAASGTIAFNNIVDSLQNSRAIKEIGQRKLFSNTTPAELAAKVLFSDMDSVSPNNAIDAGETSFITVTINNQGTGMGFAAKLMIDTDSSHVQIQKEYDLSDIPPGGSKEVKVPVKGALDLPDGKATFTFRVSEKRNYDAKPVSLRVATNRIDRPKLSIASYEINDGKTGLANGNGNGIPENGETIEMIAFITNSGTGDAKGARLTLEGINDGITVIQKESALGTIAPHQTVKGTLVFEVPRTFSGQAISTKLAVSDVRLGQDTVKEFALVFEQKRPVIAYTSRILQRGSETKSAMNGDALELEIIPRNDGGILAKNVSVQIASSSIGFSTLSKDVGEIQPGRYAAAQRFEINVPRSYRQSKLLIQVSLKQSEFEGKEDALEIPVMVRSPKLSYKAGISGKHGGNMVEQNERASLDVQIHNSGDIEAKNVRIALDIKNPDIRWMGNKEVVVPVIPANAFSDTVKFDFFVFRRVPVGELAAQITISQSDFPGEEFKHALLVKAEATEVVDIAGTASRKSLPQMMAPVQTGPVLAIANPQTGMRVYDSNINLTGTAADARGIDSIRVEINGKLVNVKTAETSDMSKKEFSAALPLEFGENRIRILARNLANLQTEETRIVLRERQGAIPTKIPPLSLFSDVDKKAAALPAKRTKADHTKWAVIIGLEKYRSVPSVTYAIRDAQAIKEYLTKLMDVPSENCFELIDDDATLGVMQDLIQDRLPSKVQKGHTVYFYFAGHGVSDIGSRTAYLLPYDGNPNNPKRTAYASNDLYESLGKLEAKNVFVFLDTCFNGFASRSENQLTEGTRPAGMQPKDPILPKNVVLFTAAGSNQVSNAYPDKQHGIFTYFLLKGLGGDAGKDKNGGIILRNLADYVEKNVQAISNREFGSNRSQMPVFRGLQGKEDLIIVDALP
ncbi:MAG: caspase family protein [Thermodesulfovibrionales bacterium]|nr:caspase family protein [Thermodesulfovibrionales bacterium]